MILDSKVFVIIVTYKGMRWYDKCFSSLLLSSVPLKVIVVDNSPGDEDASYIREKFPDFIILKPECNVGFGKGNNIALKYALENNADYVFLLNQDTWLIDSKLIEKLISICLNNIEYGVVSPLHLKSDEKTINMMLEYKSNVTSNNILIDLYKNELKDVYSTDFVNAAAWFMPRNTLEIVGGFNPMFQQYGEDDDYLNRLMFHKLKVGICPNVAIVHDHCDSLIPFAKNKSLYFHRLEILVDLNNINEKWAVFNQINRTIKKLIKCFFALDMKHLSSCLFDLGYIIKIIRKVKLTRCENIKVQSSWLF